MLLIRHVHPQCFPLCQLHALASVQRKNVVLRNNCRWSVGSAPLFHFQLQLRFALGACATAIAIASQPASETCCYNNLMQSSCVKTFFLFFLDFNVPWLLMCIHKALDLLSLLSLLMWWDDFYLVLWRFEWIAFWNGLILNGCYGRVTYFAFHLQGVLKGLSIWGVHDFFKFSHHTYTRTHTYIYTYIRSVRHLWTVAKSFHPSDRLPFQVDLPRQLQFTANLK